MDKLACIQAFIETVELGSIRMAATRLCQTDAAISKKISKLESHLKIKLLERRNRNQNLTLLGEQYYKAVCEGIEKLSYAESLLDAANTDPSGRLTVLLSRYLFPDLIAPKLASFIERYPNIQLQFNTAERTFNFANEHVDILFAVAMPPPDNENLIREIVNTQKTRSIVCATREYIEQYGTPIKPKDLLSHRYLCHIGQLPKNIICFDDGLELRIKPFLEFDETHTIIDAAKNHLGFIAVREFKVLSELQSGEFIELLPKFNKHIVKRYSYYHKKKFLDPKVKVFLDHFRYKP